MNVDPKNIGKRVKWESQSHGSWTEKEGKIVGICKIGSYPKTRAMNEYPGHRLMFDSVTFVTESTRRYFVEVRTSEKAKPLLYYPRLERMTLIENEEMQT